MTTNDVTGKSPARKAVHAEAQSVRAAADQAIADTEASQVEFAGAIADAQIHERVIRQEKADTDKVLADRLGQALYMLRGGDAPHGATPPATPPAPPTDDATPPAAPAQPVQPAADAVQTVPMPPQAAAPAAAPAGNNVNATAVVYNGDNAVGIIAWPHGPLQWVLALIGLLIGLLIGVTTAVQVAVFPLPLWEWLVITIHVVFGALWTLAGGAIGFFLGAFIGFWIERGVRALYLRTRHNNPVAQAPVGPVPPAAPPAPVAPAAEVPAPPAALPAA